MKRSTVIQNSNNNNQINETNKQSRKRLLEDNDSIKKSKKRRHISPNHINSFTTKKRISIRTKNQSQISRKSLYSTEHFNDITLPNWQCISPNIDQILSNKHTQSGVYAHEVHLVQQELEALLSISIVRENLLKDLLYHPKKQDNIRSKILQHQEAENIYTSKKIPNKPLPPLINHQQQRQNGPNLLLDRQVTMTPIIGARIDKIWSDINTYYRKISSNDLLTIENLVEFNHQLEEKLHHYQNEYKNNILTQMNIIEQLNEENFQNLFHLTQTNSLITHYIDRTSIGRFQNKFYERVPHTSPVYKTPISSPFYKKSLGNYLDHTSTLRSSPRLHPNHRINLFSIPNLKSENDPEQSSSLKSKKKTRISSIEPSSSLKFQERVQLVRDYLTDQHPIKQQQALNDIKLNKRRKNSLTISTEESTDVFESKLSSLITLLHECSSISLSALNRANLQSNNEQIWQKLNTIEHDLELLIEKIDTTGVSDNNNINIEKSFQTLEHLLKDWNKYEDDFNQQLDQLE